MADTRNLIHAAALVAAPVVVAWFGWSVPAATGLVLLLLLWRWLISLATFVVPPKTPPLVLETIPVSHFVEKVRWNMDVSGIDYVERPAGGTLGAFFLGRTVPRLLARTGAVRSSIGSSADILRYLWGAYRAPLGDAVAHLEPTPERVAFEAELDRYGRSIQVWVYHHLLEHRDLCLHAWGVNAPSVPLWQRWVLQLLNPLLAVLIRRSFRISPAHYEKACHHIEDLLADVDTKLADGRGSILGGDRMNYTDYAFAALTGGWLQPAGYGGGRADAVRIERSRAPNPMRADIERWIEDYPKAIGWVQRAYAERRAPPETPE